MDIGHEVRRYRAEPLTSPVPGAQPAPVEAPADADVRRYEEPTVDAVTTREGAAEAHA